MSEAVREAIDAAQVLCDIGGAHDLHARLKALLDDSKKQEAREAFFDEFGFYPEDAA